MLRKPLVINDHGKIDAARATSLKYLEEHEDLQARIAHYLWAYHEIGNLIPQTVNKLMSGHYFPYSESYYELENSYELCLEAFYRYAFVALRSVLELGVLGVYFAVNDKEHEHVRPWLTSEECTPRFRAALNRLKELEKFEQFDKRFGLVERILDTYDTLSDFVHTRGLRYSSRGHTRSNFNQFSKTALKQYCNAMFSIISDVIITMLLKYPIGMQGIPLTEKFGLNGPFGGFLEVAQVEFITSLLQPEEIVFLKGLSDEDPNVRGIVEYFESLPDLSGEEWRRQIEELDKQYPDLPEVPGQSGT